MNEQYILVLYIFGTLLLTVFAIFLTVFLIVQKQKQAKHILEKQALEFRHETDLLRTRLDVQEHSMTLISEEIHDNIGQLLGLTKMYLLKLSGFISGEQGHEMMKQSQELITKAIADLRHISHSLNSDLVQQLGLTTSIERELEFLSGSSGLKCSFDVVGDPVILTREKNLLLYRIVQEMLQNVVKHAQATEVVISLGFSPQDVQISIRDNGRGFDIPAALQSESLGLRNIRNRIQLLNARMDLQSEEGKGTALQFSIPLNTFNHEARRDS